MWVKSDMPILGLPPPNMDLAGWRDPFIISTPSTSLDGTYKMVIGSGIKGKGGLVPVYKSRSLRDGEQPQCHMIDLVAGRCGAVPG